MKDATLVKIVGIASISAIVIVALLHGIDSVLTGTACSIIGGIAGYEFGKGKKKT